MPIYRILTPQATQDPLKTVVLGGRFSWFAFLLPPVWALAHRMWREALAWLAVTFVLVLASRMLDTDVLQTIYCLFALWIGFAAGDLQAASLERHNHIDRGYVIAPDEYAAEQIWLQGEFTG